MENENGGMAKLERKIGLEAWQSRREGPNWNIPEKAIGHIVRVRTIAAHYSNSAWAFKKAGSSSYLGSTPWWWPSTDRKPIRIQTRAQLTKRMSPKVVLILTARNVEDAECRGRRMYACR
jgi:hypothetical protein